MLVTVTRTGGSAGAISVNYATGNGTALAGSDYLATSGTLSFADGVTASQTFSVPILNDGIPEPSESFTLTLSNATAGASLGAVSTATVTISDDDPLPVGSVQFSAGTYSVAENGTSVQVTVTRTGGSAGAITVNYTSSNGTALAGSDYTATAGTLSFADGVTSRSFSVPIVNDSVPEPSESFTLTLSNATAGASLGAVSTATVTISDDDPLPVGSVQFSAGTYSVAENGASVLVTVTRTGGSAGAISVNYATGNGTALAGSDYSTRSGTLSFADGVTASQTFSVPIVNDSVPEPSESFTLTLSNATAAPAWVP